jgi:hypothetical protein
VVGARGGELAAELGWTSALHRLDGGAWWWCATGDDEVIPPEVNPGRVVYCR